jgi:hypothetical protein
MSEVDSQFPDAAPEEFVDQPGEDDGEAVLLPPIPGLWARVTLTRSPSATLTED